MKLSLFAAFSLLIAALSAPAATAQFGGTWVLDKQRGDALPGPLAAAEVTLVVAQDDRQLTVETRYAGVGRDVAPQRVTYNLDGSEATAVFAGRVPGRGRLTARWLDAGRALELREVRSVTFKGEDRTLTTTERWELGADGATLKVRRTVDFGQGALDFNLIFNRK
jgi:hypothetical protein